MRKIGIYALLFFTAQASFGQVNCGFENLTLSPESFNNNSSSGEFECNNVSIFNSYNEQYMFWSGWAISNITDNTTAGLGNQYASRAGAGDNSENYALTYAFFGSILRFNQRSEVQSVSISNSAYAYFSMLEGDSFAKKFGGENGNDPDFFQLKIQKYLDGELGSEEVVLMLADYTFSDNSQDHILEDWNLVNCESLGLADSLLFSLSSSDNGAYGMNTPAYFCIDNIVSNPEPIGIEEIAKGDLNIFPNPAKASFSIESNETAQLLIYDMNGKEVYTQNLLNGMNTIADLSLAKGCYVCFVQGEKAIRTERLIIR